MIKLKNVLTINALSSGATGIGLVIFNGLLASVFGLDSTLPLIGVGIFLFFFAVLVFVESRKNVLQSSAIRLIIACDLLWVVVSMLVVVFQLYQLSTVGYVLISAVAVWVALMAALQMNGLKQVSGSKL